MHTLSNTLTADGTITFVSALYGPSASGITATNDSTIELAGTLHFDFPGGGVNYETLLSNVQNQPLYGVDLQGQNALFTNIGTVIGSAILAVNYGTVAAHGTYLPFIGATGIVADNSTIANSGLIEATSEGVDLAKASSLQNSGTIAGLPATLSTYIPASGTTSVEFLRTIGWGVLAGGTAGTAPTIANTGTITGNEGIGILGAATITNAAGAKIAGETDPNPGSPTSFASGRAAGISQYGYSSPNSGVNQYDSMTISNAGLITGAVGIDPDRATISNLASGTIAGSTAGIGQVLINTYNGIVSLSNAGLITATSGDGVSLGGDQQLAAVSPAYVTNSGAISGGGSAGIGVALAIGTLVNSGTISGASGIAVALTGIPGNTETSRLVIDPGAVFDGKVVASGTSVLELASSASAGVLIGAIGSEYTGFGSIVVDAGAHWNLAAASTLASGATLDDLGNLTIGGAFVNDGLVMTDPSTLLIAGTVTGTGTIDVGPSSAVTLAGAVATGQSVAFEDRTGTLVIGSPGQFAGTIDNFAAGDQIDLIGLDSGDAVSLAAGNVLDIIHAGTLLAALHLDPSANYGGDTFSIGPTAGGAVLGTDAPCFASGTRILTPLGEVPVETLRPGDSVVLARGEIVPVTWVGRRHLDITRHPRPDAVNPVLIEPGAFFDGIPKRPLRVSPDHAFCLEGHLIPAKALLNGHTVRQINCRSITYHHVELDRHAVLHADGALAESYLETGNRNSFENGGAAVMLHPDLAQTLRENRGCAPFAQTGSIVEAVRARLLARARIRTVDDPALAIRYLVDGSASIESRTAIPGLVTADPRDRRRLGVKIDRLTIGGRNIGLDHEGLTEGWHDPESDGRWTDGCAIIPANLIEGSRDVQVGIAATLSYPLKVQPGQRKIRAASR